MSVIPNKNLIILTSALKPNIGMVNFEDRCVQTIKTLQSLRRHFKDDYILFVDGSPNDIRNEPVLSEIANYVNFMVFDQDEIVKQLATAGKKSEAETALLFNILKELKQNVQLLKIMHEVKRIWKYSSRTILHDDFKIEEHDHFGKYVFKKRISSWMTELKKQNVTDHLLITRMYSFCPSLLDNYMETLVKNFHDIMINNIDTEHAHFKNINKNHLVELNTIHCEGVVAGSGQLEKY
jgi:hypothetical protein